MRPIYSSILLLIIAMFSIQFGASFAKNFFSVAGVAGATAFRVTLAAVFLSFISRIWKHSLVRSEVPIIAAYGTCLGLMNLTFYYSLQRIPLGIAVALEFVGPLSVALLSSKQKRDLVWVILAAVGIYLILPTPSSAEALDFWGVMLALVAGGFWALYIVFGQRASKHGASLKVATYGMWFAVLVTLPVGLILNTTQVLNISLLPMGFVIAVLSSAIPYSLEMKAMKGIPTKTFGILMSMEPVVACLAGYAMLQESLNLQQWVAILCIIIASAGSTLSAR